MATGVSDEEFIQAFKTIGSPTEVAKFLGLNVRSVHRRRKIIEDKEGIVLTSHVRDNTGRSKVDLEKIGARQLLDIRDGVVLAFSDGHFWPGERSTAFDALIQLIHRFGPKLKAVVNNGDAFDGARISRWPPTEWAHMPTVVEELEAVAERLGEIEAAVPEGIPLPWLMGNHDSRYSMRLAVAAPEFVGVEGFDLPDHFPAWSHSWSLMVNDDIPNGKTMFKHRLAGGIHANYNNTLRSGVNIVTSHLHKLMITPWSDYNGRRYGVDTGTLSDFGPDASKFTYTEDAPLNWSSGFAVLTYDYNGMLLPPELCEVREDKAYFRGEVISMNGQPAMREILK